MTMQYSMHKIIDVVLKFAGMWGNVSWLNFQGFGEAKRSSKEI